MCFEIHPKCPKARTAEKDIVCYKEGYRHTDGTFSPFYKSSFYYRLGEVTKLPWKWRRWPVESEDTICIGFHSYSNKKRLGSYIDHVKCIIPKGAHYFYNPEAGEYVSDRIIVQEFID